MKKTFSMTKNKHLFWVLWLSLLSLPIYAGIPDTLFLQEYQQAYPLNSPAENDVRTILVDISGHVWAGTTAGLFVLNPATGRWQAALDKENQGPVFDLSSDQQGILWIAAWNGLYRKDKNDNIVKVNNVRGPISVVNETGSGILALGSFGMWRLVGDSWQREKLKVSRQTRSLIDDRKGGFYLGTGKGLYHQSKNKLTLFQNKKELLSDDIYGLAFSDQGDLWIGGLGGITVYDAKTDKRIKTYTPKEGLSNIWVRCIQKAPDGTMWVGTDLGVIRFKDSSHSLRHSRRWLLSDKVRDIAFDKDGNAWIATSSGVSAIKKRRMTLAQKAKYYENILNKRHIRKPFLVGKCRLRIAGDTASWEPMDDDNDGQYTAMYLAMESYRYAVTKDPVAKENAIRAFHALKYLQTVTATTGFVSRSVIPVSWSRMADLNETVPDRLWAERIIRNPRYKRVEKHWRKSGDGNWLWKGDTSSDEITGHMYGYLFFYDLVADAALKEEVKKHILRIVNYIIDNDYVLKAVDGTHTTWGVWSPEYLNHDPDWASEKGINSLEILSYLKLAWHVSGDKYYQKEYEKLLNLHDYKSNILHAKSTLPAWRTFIDDELVSLAYPALMLYEKDPALLTLYRKSMDNWYEACKNDNSPFYYFIYNAFRGKNNRLERSVFFLRDNPLDLINWTVDNTKREDLTLTHSPILEDTETSRLVPPSERGIMRWDKNPWQAVRGDGGRTESSGDFWLLPYWMGRYYGFIK